MQGSLTVVCFLLLCQELQATVTPMVALGSSGMLQRWKASMSGNCQPPLSLSPGFLLSGWHADLPLAVLGLDDRKGKRKLKTPEGCSWSTY